MDSSATSSTEASSSPRKVMSPVAAAASSASKRPAEPLYYGDYLQVDKLLSAQVPKSREAGNEAHEEMLFITTHQVYELLFKQVLHELNSITAIFAKVPVDDRTMGTAVGRLQRIRAIQDPMLQMIGVLETMSPLDFLSFRDYLYPASGFQSLQWRLIENTLGLTRDVRLPYGYKSYCSYLKPADAAVAEGAESTPEHPSLFALVEAWLERCPLLTASDFSWWGHYQDAVTALLDADADCVSTNPALTPEQREAQLAELEATRSSFASLFDETAHDALRKRGDRRLSYRATQAALLITLYCDEPLLTLPHRLLSLLVEIDEMFTAWRGRHASMVHRMLGVKMGTGGSSGYHYLKATAERHKVFSDLCNLSTFLIPRAALPPLPDSVKQRLAFAWGGSSVSGSGEAASKGGSDGVHAPAGGVMPFAQGYSVGIAAPSAAAASHIAGREDGPTACGEGGATSAAVDGPVLRCPVTGRTFPAGTVPVPPPGHG